MFLMKTNKSITNFGKRLKEIRQSKGLTQVQLSNISGISRRAIAHYETEAINPPVNNVNILSDVLNISVDELLGKKELKKKIDVPFKVMKNVRIIEQLPVKDQNVIFQLIKSLAEKNKLKD